jgi:uncharacterized protein (DUF2336 family)
MDFRMGAAASLISELEEAIQNGTRERRAVALHRVTALFLHGADQYSDAHVDLFDEVFGRLIDEIETKARAELASKIAPVKNAPVKLLRTLANDEDIAIAGPVLALAPRLAEADLIDVAESKGQAHLQAISTRRALGEAVTDVLVRRGDREVACRLVDNRGARISDSGFSNLVKRAATDGILAEKVGRRPDIPEAMFRELLTKATAVVQNRLFTSVNPAAKAEVTRVLNKVSQEVGARVGPRDYRAAQRLILGLGRAGRLNEAVLAAFCGDGKYEESVVALAALAKVPVNVADRLMSGDRPDPVLILGKAAGLSWPTVKALILQQRRDTKGGVGQGFEAAFSNYGRLSDTTAQRVVRFWQVRHA